MTTEQEFNNNTALANALTLGTSMTGQLATSTDVDWYRFTTTAAGSLSIVLDVPTSLTSDYFRVGLYDAITGALMNSYSTGSDKTFQTAVPAAGSYYLAVDAPPRLTAPPVGSYVLPVVCLQTLLVTPTQTAPTQTTA